MRKQSPSAQGGGGLFVLCSSKINSFHPSCRKFGSLSECCYVVFAVACVVVLLLCQINH